MTVINLTLLFIMAGTTTAFPLLYLRSNWRQTHAGRGIMLSAVALALLVDISVIGHFIRSVNPVLSAIVTLAVFLLIIAGSLYMLATLLKAQCTEGKWQRLFFWRKHHH